MSTKTINTRLINKHDINSNWLKAENFIPLEGEIIIYDKDEKTDIARMKIGDGVTNVNSLPFVSANYIKLEKNAYYGDSDIEITSPEYFTYINNEDGTYTIDGLSEIGQVASPTEIVFPYEIDGIKITSIGSFDGSVLFNNSSSIKSIIMPDTIEKIKYKAFSGDFSSLEYLRLSNKLKEIEGENFYSSTLIDELYVPDSLEFIAYNTHLCSFASRVSMPHHSFTHDAPDMQDYSITTLIIRGGTEFGVTTPCFRGNDSKIILPDTCKKISVCAFWDSENPTLVIPSSVTQIEGNKDSIFSSCTNPTVICEQGSYADTWAQENGINIKYDIVNASNFLLEKGTGDNSVQQNNNTAISTNSYAIGGYTEAGGRGFKIIACSDNGDGTGTYTLSSTTGIIGDSMMEYSVRLSAAKYKAGFIAAIDGNVVTVTNYPNIALETDRDDPDNFSIENYLTIVGRPDLGDIDIGFNAYTEGERTIAQDRDAHAEGRDTQAIGQYGHAEGRQTVAAYAAHAEGRNTQATGEMSHSEGTGTVASGKISHAEGNLTVASGTHAHSEGSGTTASGENAHAEGAQTQSTSFAAHSEGYMTKAANIYSHAEGYNTTASGEQSHSEGVQTSAIGKSSHAEGRETKAYGEAAHAEGYNTTASQYTSHAEGANTTASGQFTHAEGIGTIASGEGSHAEGISTSATGMYSHAEGHNTKATAYASHAEGSRTEANAVYSHVEGLGNIAKGQFQHIQGKYAEIDEIGNYSHIVGGGREDSGERKNIHTLDWSGNAWFSGNVTVGPNKDILATEGIIDTKIAAFVDSAPETLNTLNELAEALGDDPNFATTITNELANKSDLDHSHDNATTTSAGFMSAEDKTKLEGIENGAEVNVQSDWDENNNSNAGYIKNKIPIKNGSGKDSITVVEGESSGDYSVAGGITDTSIVESIAGSAASLLGNLEPAKAAGNMSLAFGAEVEAKADGSISIGVANTTGVKGYYWHTIDFVNKTITLSTSRPTTLSSSVKAPTDIDWQVGDYISIFNSKSYTLFSQITAISGNKITVDNLPFTTNEYDTTKTILGSTLTVYPVTYDKPEDRIIFAAYEDEYILSKNRWMSRSGSVVLGFGAFSYGALNTSMARLSYTRGMGNLAGGIYSEATGLSTQATGDISHTEGNNTRAKGENSHAEGYMTHAEGLNSHSEGNQTKALGGHSHAEGHNAIAEGNVSHVEGFMTHAKGHQSHAEGNNTHADGENSHAEGYTTHANGKSSHAEGTATYAEGENSHAEGWKSIANGTSTHVEGYNNIANATNSHAEGENNTILEGAVGSHVEGCHNTATSPYQHVQGREAIIDEEGKYLHIVGNGKSWDSKSNAHTLDWDGNAWYAGDITAEKSVNGDSAHFDNGVTVGVENDKLLTHKDLKNSTGGFEAGINAQATNRGGAVGCNTYATTGGAVGYGATTDGGGAVGPSARSNWGFAGGSQAWTEAGGSIGGSTYSYYGGAVGLAAKASNGGAIGQGSQTQNGFAGGYNAKTAIMNEDGTVKTAIDAIQIGTGTNSDERTLQIYDYKLLDANGKIPIDRLDSMVVTDTYIGNATENALSQVINLGRKPKVVVVTTSGGNLFDHSQGCRSGIAMGEMCAWDANGIDYIAIVDNGFKVANNQISDIPNAASTNTSGVVYYYTAWF